MSIIDKFLTESNAIEGVYSHLALQQARWAWDYCISEDKLTPGVILKTHKILMLHQPLMPNEKGYFREVPVYIGGREAMNARNIHYAIENWCDRIEKVRGVAYDTKDANEISKSLHIQYENIHPFIDGNGRSGRIFMNWFRLKIGLPVLVIEERRKQAYYRWFKNL